MSIAVTWILLFGGEAMNKRSPAFLGEYAYENSCKAAAERLIKESQSLRGSLVCVQKFVPGSGER